VFEDYSLSRRDVLAATGAVAGGSAVALANYYSTELDVDIYLTEELADRAESERGRREYPARRLEEFGNRFLTPLVNHAGVNSLNFNYRTEEPEIKRETADETLELWREESSSDADAAILLTNQKYPQNVGVAERTDDPFDNTVSVLGEAYDFLDLEEGEICEEVLVSEYELLETGRQPNFSPFKTAIAGLHELGHNFGLEHEDGDAYENEEGVALSVMAASYLDEHEEDADFRLSDDVYWRTEFSDNSVDKLERLLIENSRDQR
jgi:hypothetical protein